MRRQLSSDNFTLKRSKASRADEKKERSFPSFTSIIKRKDLLQNSDIFSDVAKPRNSMLNLIFYYNLPKVHRLGGSLL